MQWQTAHTLFAFGLVIVATAYSIGNVSGCHINPAVSLAMLISGKMNIKDFIGYIVAQFAGAVIGLTLLLVHIFGIHFTGTSVNPARSFGPAILSGSTQGLWVFIVAPLVGTAIAALVYKFLDGKKA